MLQRKPRRVVLPAASAPLKPGRRAEKKSPNPNPVNSIFVRGGTTKNLDMLVVKYDKAEHNYKDKEGNDKTVHFMDAQAAQVEGANPDLKRQINPHLFSQKNHEGPHAGKYNTQVGYYDSQMDAIKEAAGDNVFAVNDKDGNQVGSVYAVKSNVIFRKHEVDGKEVSNGAAMDTKTLQPVSDEFAKQLHEMEANGGGRGGPPRAAPSKCRPNHAISA